MRYPLPFLTYYYYTYPEDLPNTVASQGNDTQVRVDEGQTDNNAGNIAQADASREGAGEGAEGAGDGLMSLRNKQTAPIYAHYTILEDRIVAAGPNSGKREQVWRCCVTVAPDEECGVVRKITFVNNGKAPSTSNLVKHVREAAEGCAKHNDVLIRLNEASRFQVEVQPGQFEQIMTFEEAFPHHVRYCLMVAMGTVSGATAKSSSFREYVRGYAPTATFPHHTTQIRIIQCIDELQMAEQKMRIGKLVASYHNGPCVGLQLDMWTDTDTNTCIFCGGESNVSDREKE